jgi:cytochrome P450
MDFLLTNCNELNDPESPGSIAAGLLPGPLSEMNHEAAFLDITMASAAGESHLQWVKYQELYGDRGLATNVVIPTIMTSLKTDLPAFTAIVLLSDPDDCGRIAKTHVKKAPNFTPILADSVISTTDNDLWKKQRSYLTGAFMPTSSLSHIFDTSVERAQVCRVKLGEMSEAGAAPCDMSDFFLHEAQAQLQLALFGMDENFMEETNTKLREAFAGKAKEENYVTNFLLDLLEQMDIKKKGFAAATEPGAKIAGPLSSVIDNNETNETDDELMIKFGNSLIFAFAGHDTTGHTMTWLTFEVAQRPDIQARIQTEVDALFAEIEDEGRPLQYRDCRKLPFLTRCVTETLRLWPAVPNGTFRELQFDDVIKGPGGKDVKLKKGTYVQVTNWSRHRNPELWGDDVNEFNPDRDFQGDEIWGDESFAAFNPSSNRFSPFTFPPRDCLGKNFAQMEMRTILAHLFRDFDFNLAPPTAGFDRNKYQGINRGTMGPQDISGYDIRDDGSKRARYGMHCYAVPREHA